MTEADLNNGGRAWLLPLLLALVAMAVYAGALRNGFVWDDQSIIVTNQSNRSLANVGTVFTSADVVFSDDVNPYYRPLNRLTYLLDYQFYGLNPAGYHAVSVLLHAVNVLLLFGLARRLSGSNAVAFPAALLFALHPVNAEAVNFLSGRNNLLATLFSLATMLAWLRAAAGNRSGWRLIAAAFLFLGLLCKETAAMALPLLAWFELRRVGSIREFIGNHAVRFIPLAVAAVVYLAMRVAVLAGTVATFQPLPLGERLLRNLYIIPKYLRLILFPAGLNAYYTVPPDYLEQLWIYPLWALLVVLVVFILKRGNTVTAFGLAWVTWNFLPISNLVPIPSAPLADRYLYLPLAGVALVAAGSFPLLRPDGGLNKWLAVAWGTMLVLLATTTVKRTADWRDDRALFTSMVRTEPTSVFGYYNLGNALRDRDLVGARQAWQRAVELDPKHSRAWSQLGNTYLLQERPDLAEQSYRQALAADPGNAESHYNLAMVLDNTGRLAEALHEYQLFLRRVPPEHRHMEAEVRARVVELERLTNRTGKE